MTPENFSGAQHAYLKARSVQTALYEVVQKAETSLRQKEYTLAAFLDIEGAFKKVEIGAIVAARGFTP